MCYKGAVGMGRRMINRQQSPSSALLSSSLLYSLPLFSPFLSPSPLSLSYSPFQSFPLLSSLLSSLSLFSLLSLPFLFSLSSPSPPPFSSPLSLLAGLPLALSH